jgi:type IV fimbrial biogenesis protein FimT
MREICPTIRRQDGLTTIEVAVVGAILAIVAVAATQGMAQLKVRQQLAAAAAEFETDVQHTRSLAVLRATPLRLAFVADIGGSCYVIHSGAPGSCSCRVDGQTACDGDAEPLRSVGFAAASGLSVAGNVRSLNFDPVGTVTPAGTLKFTGRDGAALHQVVNVMGRVRTCSSGGAVAGVKPC